MMMMIDDNKNLQIVQNDEFKLLLVFEYTTIAENGRRKLARA